LKNKINSKTGIVRNTKLSEEEKKILKNIMEVIQDLRKDLQIKLEDLKEAKDKSEEEIEKIIQTSIEPSERKEELYDEQGKKCIRVKDIEKLRSGARTIIPSASWIIKKNRGLINEINRILGIKTEKVLKSRGYKSGRLNRDVIRAVASNYQYRSVFSQVAIKEKGKMMLLLDLSRSMSKNKMPMLKEAVITFAMALENSVDLRIVGYTTGHTFIFKEFGEKTDIKKLDLIGRRREGGGTPTGISLKIEFTYMKRTYEDDIRKVPVILITDGFPDSVAYTQKVITQIRNHSYVFGIGLEIA